MAMNRNLSYFMSRVEAVSTNTFRLEPQNSTTATPNQSIRFSLPSNALWNTRSTQLLFSASTSGANAGGRLPAKIDSLVDRYEILAGGVQISQGFALYNVLRHAKDSIMGEKCDSVLGHPEMVRAKSYVSGAAIAGTANETYVDTNNQTQFAISHWEGFLGSVSPAVLDTSLLPDLTLVVHLAGKEVLSSVAGVELSNPTEAGGVVTEAADTITRDGNRAASYTLSNIRLLVEVIGLGSSVYDELVQRRIADIGYLSLPFKSYQSFVDSHTGSTKFSVSSQSLDRLWIVHRAAGHDTQSAPVVVNGYKRAGCFTSPATIAATNGAAGAVTQDIGLPQYEIGGILRTNGEKMLGKYFNFARNNSAAGSTFQVQLNGSMVPQFAATAEEMYAISKNSVQHSSYESKLTLDQYLSNYFVQCIRLNLPDSELSNEISGIDTRSINLSGMYNTTHITGGTNVVIFAEMSSVLRVGSNRSIEVVM